MWLVRTGHLQTSPLPLYGCNSCFRLKGISSSSSNNLKLKSLSCRHHHYQQQQQKELKNNAVSLFEQHYALVWLVHLSMLVYAYLIHTYSIYFMGHNPKLSFEYDFLPFSKHIHTIYRCSPRNSIPNIYSL